MPTKLIYPYQSSCIGDLLCDFDEKEQIQNLFDDKLQLKDTYEAITSGSTGSPKKVILTKQQVLASIEQTRDYFHLKENDISLICLSAKYIAGKMMWLRSYYIQMGVRFVPPKANPLIGFSNSMKFDFAAFVPMQLQTILEETPEKLTLLNNVKAILIGGAPISIYQEKLFQQIQAPVYHTYGMTETVSHIAVRKVNGDDRQDKYHLFNGIEAKLNDKQCLCIKGKVTNDLWIETNDKVEILSNNEFKWLGRVDNVINSGGVKIQVEQVEKKIENLFHLMGIKNRFFISSINNSRFGDKLVLLIEGERLEKLPNFEEELSKFEIPKELFFIKQFIQTESGKVDRKANKTLIKS